MAKVKRYTICEYTGQFGYPPGSTDAATFASLWDMNQGSYDGTSGAVFTGLAAVKALRSDYKALLYRNMRSIGNTGDIYGASELATCTSNNWLLHNGSLNGPTVTASDTGGTFVDIGNPDYQAWIATQVYNQIVSYGWDGLMADNAGPFYGGAELWFGTGASFWNPRTGAVWTDQNVITALIGLHNAIKNKFGSSKLLLTNGIFNGQRYYWHQSAYDQYFAAGGTNTDGFATEGGWYDIEDQGNPANPGWSYQGTTDAAIIGQWKQALDFLVQIQTTWLARGSNKFYCTTALLAHTDIGNPFNLPAGCTKLQMATFGLASTLLGIGNNDQNYFATFCDTALMQTLNALHNAPLGTPSGAYYQPVANLLFARDFSNGLVLVNPSNENQTAALSQTLHTVDGTAVSGSATLAPHTGLILLGTVVPPVTEYNLPAFTKHYTANTTVNLTLA